MRRTSHVLSITTSEAAKPQLTSLVDVLTVLLIFLIHSFSAEASDVSPVQSVNLPESSSKKSPRDMASIEITPRDIQVNGMHVATLKSVKDLGPELEIDRLYKELTKIDMTGDKKEVMIQADKSIEFAVVKKVMYTCSKAGASEYTVLVINAE
jgi:biopolymer transport protein ExbD